VTRDQAARLIRGLQRHPDHYARLACGYGVHDFAIDTPEPGYKQCRKCEATYAVPIVERNEP
jgi:hypothetical protein